MIIYIFMTTYIYMLYIYNYIHIHINIIPLWWLNPIQSDGQSLFKKRLARHFSEVPEAFATRRFGRPSPNGDR